MTTGPISPRQADTRDTNERILAAAGASLARSGELSFNAIAKEAGVGVGTVYRRFPTPEELILAVYRIEVRHLVEVVPLLLAEHPPEVAFQVWVSDHLAHYMVTKRGLANALRVAATGREVHNRAFADITGAVATLIRANAEAGTVRPDLDPRTVLNGLGGLLLLDPSGDRQAQTASLTDLLWRGMRRDSHSEDEPAPDVG